MQVSISIDLNCSFYLVHIFVCLQCFEIKYISDCRLKTISELITLNSSCYLKITHIINASMSTPWAIHTVTLCYYLLLDRVHINIVYCRLFKRKFVQCTIHHSAWIRNYFIVKNILFIFGCTLDLNSIHAQQNK